MVKVSILGSGNIGSKLALKLVESNVNVSTTRKNNYKGKIIALGLNNIMSENTASCITFNQDILKNIFNSDVIVGAANGVSVIDEFVKGY